MLNLCFWFFCTYFLYEPDFRDNIFLFLLLGFVFLHFCSHNLLLQMSLAMFHIIQIDFRDVFSYIFYLDLYFCISAFILLGFAFLQPQSASPDVFLWLVAGSKRVAYARILARSSYKVIIKKEKH